MIWEAFFVNAAMLLGAGLIAWAVALETGMAGIAHVWRGAGVAFAALLAWLRVPDAGPPAHLLLLMTGLWGLRLAWRAGRRLARRGEDRRYALLLEEDRAEGRLAAGMWRRVFAPQVLLVLVGASPAALGILAAEGVWSLNLVAVAGFALWLVGMILEAVSEWRLDRFLADPAHERRILDQGVWHYSRHPNYFGTALVWWGIWLVAASLGWWVAAATLVGPLLMTVALRSWTGLPVQERALVRNRSGYARYQARTSAMLPLPPRQGRR